MIAARSIRKARGSVPGSTDDALKGSPHPNTANAPTPIDGGQQRDNDTVMPLAAVAIPDEIWREVICHLEEALPSEGCGLLAASGARRHGRVVHFFPGTNELNSPTRYRMAGREVVEAHKVMRERDWWLAAIVHSHPKGPATLSATDLREALYPHSALLVVDFSGPEPVAKAWQVQNGPPRLAVEVALVFD
jgi:proteasome lid subunit RPN8/RPN11